MLREPAPQCFGCGVDKHVYSHVLANSPLTSTCLIYKIVYNLANEALSVIKTLNCTVSLAFSALFIDLHTSTLKIRLKH